MNRRERFEATFAFRGVDRPLLFYEAEPEVNERLGKYLSRDTLEGVLGDLDIDFRRLIPKYVGPELPKLQGGRVADIWGIVREPVANPTGVHMEVVNYPWEDMKTAGEVEEYPWPKADWFDYSHYADQCRAYKDYVVYFGRPGLGCLLNSAGFGRGYDRVLLDMAMRDEVTLALFKKRFEFDYEFIRRGLAAAEGNIDVLFIGEDLGTQEGLLISPDYWDEMIRPYLKQLIDLGHEYGAKVMMHSCGSVVRLIPRLIELGLDCLQAVQPQAKGMDPESLTRDFGGQLVFCGTMDIQETLPRGTAEQVRREVRRRRQVFRKCGGFILGPCHNIQTDTPLENIIAMYDEGAKCE